MLTEQDVSTSSKHLANQGFHVTLNLEPPHDVVLREQSEHLSSTSSRQRHYDLTLELLFRKEEVGVFGGRKNEKSVIYTDTPKRKVI